MTQSQSTSESSSLEAAKNATSETASTAAEADTNNTFQTQEAHPTPPEPSTKDITLCGVCEINPPKYKCPRCYLPYCSVVCSKVHRESHPADPEPKPVAEVQPSDATSHDAAVPSLDPSNPFRALDTSDKLQYLFRKYPNLTQQLQDIYEATQPPAEAPDKRIPASMMHGVAKKDTWNHDIGLKNGKEALRKARRAEGESGDAIREYSELVLHLISSQDDNDEVSMLLQQQAAQKDATLIERLMAQERR